MLPETASDRKVFWNSSNESIAAVSQDGLVTAHKNGTAVITGSSKDNRQLAASCTVTVTGFAEGDGEDKPEELHGKDPKEPNGEELKESNEENPKKPAGLPNTGDEAALPVAGLAVNLSALAVLGAVFLRQYKKK